MAKEINVRWGWLRFMYIYTIVGAGGFGLGIIVVPEVIKAAFGWPVEEPVVLGIVGSVYVAFGILSILGLRSPLRFVPVLLLQLCYKSIWLIGVILPMLIAGRFPRYALSMVIIFATYIIGDLVAIPFSYILARQPGASARRQPLDE
ncbi:MAG TPA: hypothetical protein G4O11_11065 [Anaerolineae bacterium]|nr:hypothetical protein [Anaerolineae bacterium]